MVSGATSRASHPMQLVRQNMHRATVPFSQPLVRAVRFGGEGIASAAMRLLQRTASVSFSTMGAWAAMMASP